MISAPPSTFDLTFISVSVTDLISIIGSPHSYKITRVRGNIKRSSGVGRSTGVTNERTPNPCHDDKVGAVFESFAFS